MGFRWLLAVFGVALGLAAPTACKKRLLAEPAPPPTPTCTPTIIGVPPAPTATATETPFGTPDCHYPDQVLALPGSQPVTIPTFALTPKSYPINNSPADALIASVTFSLTPVVFTGTPIAHAAQVLRSEADWVGYCNAHSVDPTATPAPVDFSAKMIVIQEVYSSSTNGDSVVLDSLCRYPDCYRLSLKQGGVAPGINMLNYVGYVVDQAPLSVWVDSYFTWIPLPNATSTPTP